MAHYYTAQPICTRAHLPLRFLAPLLSLGFSLCYRHVKDPLLIASTTPLRSSTLSVFQILHVLRVVTPSSLRSYTRSVFVLSSSFTRRASHRYSRPLFHPIDRSLILSILPPLLTFDLDQPSYAPTLENNHKMGLSISRLREFGLPYARARSIAMRRPRLMGTRFHLQSFYLSLHGAILPLWQSLPALFSRRLDMARHPPPRDRSLQPFRQEGDAYSHGRSRRCRKDHHPVQAEVG